MQPVGSMSKVGVLDCSIEGTDSHLQSPGFDLSSDFGVLRSFGSDRRFYPMNALEILRETVRILRFNSTGFLLIAVLLICPVSAIVLSNALIKSSVVRILYVRLWKIARYSGLSSSPLIQQSCHHFAEMVVSAIFCFPLFITLSLLSKAAIVYSVACTYAGMKVIASSFIEVVVKIWRRVVFTYMWVCVLIIGCLALFLAILFSTCSCLALLGYPSGVIVYPAFMVALIFAVVIAHTIIICNVAIVISVLEDVSGPQALLRSVFLIKGQTNAGLLIYLGSTIGMAFVEGLFQHRVKTLSYGDGSSRIWEGPLLVTMHSFVVLTDSMMSAVFYFTCRSSSIMVPLDEDSTALSDSPSR